MPLVGEFGCEFFAASARVDRESIGRAAPDCVRLTRAWLACQLIEGFFRRPTQRDKARSPQIARVPCPVAHERCQAAAKANGVCQSRLECGRWHCNPSASYIKHHASMRQ
jgi:hypothetical protein